jgi:hypothetical protein
MRPERAGDQGGFLPRTRPRTETPASCTVLGSPEIAAQGRTFCAYEYINDVLPDWPG